MWIIQHIPPRCTLISDRKVSSVAVGLSSNVRQDSPGELRWKITWNGKEKIDPEVQKTSQSKENIITYCSNLGSSININRNFSRNSKSKYNTLRLLTLLSRWHFPMREILLWSLASRRQHEPTTQFLNIFIILLILARVNRRIYDWQRQYLWNGQNVSSSKGKRITTKEN